MNGFAMQLFIRSPFCMEGFGEVKKGRGHCRFPRTWNWVVFCFLTEIKEMGGPHTGSDREQNGVIQDGETIYLKKSIQK